MIDYEWIESLKNGGIEDNNIRAKKDIVADIISYYKNYFMLDCHY